MPQIGETISARKIGYKSTGTLIWLACRICGKERWVRRRQGKSTICRLCQQKIIANNQQKENHPNWTGGYQEMKKRKRAKITTTCPNCQKEVTTNHESMLRWLRQHADTTLYQPLCPSCNAIQVFTGRVAWNRDLHNWWTEKHKENHLNAIYINGNSFIPYDPNFNRKLHEAIRQRDNYTCQLCGIPQNGRVLDVHHINYDKSSNPQGLVSLCFPCHIKTRTNRLYWQVYFTELLIQRGVITHVSN